MFATHSGLVARAEILNLRNSWALPIFIPRCLSSLTPLPPCWTLAEHCARPFFFGKHRRECGLLRGRPNCTIDNLVHYSAPCPIAQRPPPWTLGKQLFHLQPKRVSPNRPFCRRDARNRAGSMRALHAARYRANAPSESGQSNASPFPLPCYWPKDRANALPSRQSD